MSRQGLAEGSLQSGFTRPRTLLASALLLAAADAPTPAPHQIGGKEPARRTF